MQTYQVGLIGLFIAAILVGIALRSWFRRRALQESQLEAPQAFEGFDGEIFEAFYVATTFASEPLNRIAAHGLGMRGRAQLSIGSKGAGVSRKGERSFLIPLSNLISVETSTAVIDKAVESEGLTVLLWKLGNKELQTYLRFVSPADRQKFINSTHTFLAVKK